MFNRVKNFIKRFFKKDKKKDPIILSTALDIQNAARRNELEAYFVTNQEKLLWMANLPEGRKLLDCADDAPITKVTPNAIIYFKGIENNRKVLRGQFFVDTHVSKALLPILLSLELADKWEPVQDEKEAFLHYAGLKITTGLYPVVRFTTFDAGAGDGEVNRNSNNTWATQRAASTGDEVINQPTINDQGRWAAAYVYSTTFYFCGRTFYPVDTSGLGAGAIVTASLFKVTSNTRSDMDGVLGVLVPSTQASTSTLVNTDYDNIAYTAWSDAVMVGAAASTQYTLTMNATGRAGLNLTGFTKFAAISKTYDFDNASPGAGARWGSIYNSGTGTGSQKPHLDITFTTPIDVNSERGAKIHGQVSTSAERAAKITGKVSVSSERFAKIEGAGTDVDDERAAKIHGQASTSSERAAKTRGALETSSQRSAKIVGLFTWSHEAKPTNTWSHEAKPTNTWTKDPKTPGG